MHLTDMIYRDGNRNRHCFRDLRLGNFEEHMTILTWFTDKYVFELKLILCSYHTYHLFRTADVFLMN